MESVIGQLFEERLKSLYPKCKVYKAKKQKALEAEDKFISSLSKEKRHEYESLLHYIYDCSSMELYEAFADGLKIGLKLMTETFTN